ncbi:hypothetical protein B0H12DRAFT_1083014 [Mycena haematopus]|nr:hypothetical protein B0H12DRAFT_1083014 [Mycena haematopus]
MRDGFSSILHYITAVAWTKKLLVFGIERSVQVAKQPKLPLLDSFLFRLKNAVFHVYTNQVQKLLQTTVRSQLQRFVGPLANRLLLRRGQRVLEAVLPSKCTLGGASEEITRSIARKEPTAPRSSSRRACSRLSGVLCRPDSSCGVLLDSPAFGRGIPVA